MKTIQYASILPVLAAVWLLWTPRIRGAEKAVAKGDYIVYIGTYTGPKSQGIYAYRFDAATGQLTSLGLAAETVSPSYLVVHPNHRFLYAVNEVASYEGRPGGGVSAFGIDRRTGKLSFLNEVSSRGAGPCHLTVDKTGKDVLVANYGGGSIAVFPVLRDGRLGEASAFVQHKGSSVNPKRQEGPHAHCIVPSPDNRFVLTADLGLDQVLVYRFDPAQGSLVANTPPFAKLRPGTGPRHLAFHPNGKFVYVNGEMASTISAFSYDISKGVLQELQTLSTLPKDFSGRSSTAEVAVHPGGKFVYVSNRGHDSIAVFAVDRANGTLTPVEYVSTQGKGPRNFEIDPSGAFLFAANQHSGTIVVFRIDAQTGRLSPASQVVEVPSPVCVKFVAMQ